MSKKLRAIIYIALLSTVLLSVTSCVDEDEPMAEPRGTITGTVTDADGEPIADVNVTLAGVGEDEISVTTASDGKYFLRMSR